MATPDYSFIMRYAKLEEGDIFTGFVPLDYYNYGFEQGYDKGYAEGLNDVDSNGYTLIGNLSWHYSYSGGDAYIENELISTDFGFNGTNYNFDQVTTEDTAPFAFMATDGTYSGYQPGFKVSSDYLYGNIMITMPWYFGVNYFDIVIHNKVNGANLILSYVDSAHWQFNELVRCLSESRWASYDWC